jgi:NAD(P)-dependent dehydrogenase (short-subunit alcohol dehydrogenase family)
VSRVVLVTGASRGIGAAVCAALTARGDTVLAAGRDRAALAGVPSASTVSADVRDPAAGQLLVDTAVGRYGRLDAVVASAGLGWAGPFAEMPVDRLAEVVDVDLRAPLLLARAAVPVLPAGGGLVFLGSIAGLVGVPEEAVYAAAKAGLEMFAAMLREQHPALVVATVVPGAVDTGFFATRGRPYDRRVPRPLDPAVIAAAVLAALDRGGRSIRPRWLAVPARLSAAAPGTYRRLARRFS